MSPDARAGGLLFTQAGCLVCHTYRGKGTSNLGAPDLTHEGAKSKGVQFQIRQLRCPPCVKPDSLMPKYDKLGKRNLRQIATFLEASR